MQVATGTKNKWCLIRIKKSVEVTATEEEIQRKMEILIQILIFRSYFDTWHVGDQELLHLTIFHSNGGQ